MATTGSFFVTVLCIVHRYHVYKDVWSPNIGQAFVSFTEEENTHDRKAVTFFTITKISGFTRILELAKNLNFRAFQAKIAFSKLDFQIFEHLSYMGCWHAQCQVHNPPSYTLNPVWCDVCHLMMHRGVVM